MPLFLIEKTDGSAAYLRTVSDEVTAQAAIAKWPPEMQASVVAVRAVETLPSDPPFANLQSTLLVRVDTDAERERRRYITPGAGQAMTYQEKRLQAEAVFALGDTPAAAEAAANALSAEEAAADYPILFAGIGIDAETLWGCSQIVIAMAEQWNVVAGAIERVRLQGKKSISDASDAASAKAAYEAITWPTP